MDTVDTKKEQERAQLHSTIWKAANDLVHGGGVSPVGVGRCGIPTGTLTFVKFAIYARSSVFNEPNAVLRISTSVTPASTIALMAALIASL